MIDDAGVMPVQGVWNAYVESGATKDERRARLNLCPDSLKPGVLSHLRTVAGVREAARVRTIRQEIEEGARAGVGPAGAVTQRTE